MSFGFFLPDLLNQFFLLVVCFWFALYFVVERKPHLLVLFVGLHFTKNHCLLFWLVLLEHQLPHGFRASVPHPVCRVDYKQVQFHH